MDFSSVWKWKVKAQDRSDNSGTNSEVMDALRTQMNLKEESWADLQFWSYL